MIPTPANTTMITRTVLKIEFPHWEVWRGVTGEWYSRCKKSSPPLVWRASSLAQLRVRMASGTTPWDLRGVPHIANR
jgi:hypothetical protein